MLIYLFCEESVHKRDFWVVRVLNTLWIQGLCEICVLQTLLFLFRWVHLLSVYIGLKTVEIFLSFFFFKKLYSFSFYLYVYMSSWIHFCVWVEVEACVFFDGYSVVASSFVEEFFSWLNCVDTFVKISSSIYVYISGLDVVLLI